MRLLLDESLPRDLGDSFVGHDVSTAQQQGWSGIQNGELLSRAGDAGFDAFITPDRGIEFQQNLDRLPLTVILMVAGGIRVRDLLPLVPSVLTALEVTPPCAFVRVDA